jgi:hypothetical protein
LSTPQIHEWFRRRMAVFAVGLLPPAEEEAFVDHRASCTACRADYDAFDDWERDPRDAWQDRHIPSALLAHWDRARDEIRGLELSTATEHLESCALCQDGLRIANLVRRAALEESPEISAAAARRDITGSLSALRQQPVPADERAIRRESAPPRMALERRPAGPSDRRVWLLGGWAALATAAAIALIVIRPLPAPNRSTPVTVEPAPIASAPSPSPLPTALQDSGTSITIALLPRAAEPLRPVSRDASQGGAVLKPVPGTHVLVLHIEPFLMIEDSDRVAVEVLDARQRVLASTRGTWRDLHGGRDVLVDADPAVLPAGSYALRVRPLAAGDGMAVNLPFTIARAN